MTINDRILPAFKISNSSAGASPATMSIDAQMRRASRPPYSIFNLQTQSAIERNTCAAFFFLLLSILLHACNTGPSSERSSSNEAPTAADENLPKIVAFGNSLTAGMGLPLHESYPSLLQQMLHNDGYKYEVVNAGVSGDTTAGGLRRIDWSLQEDVEILILELGANDVLRGMPIDHMKNNLAEIIQRAKKQNVQVLLAGIEAPVNAGPDYRREVHEAFRDLAREQNVAFLPFVLKDLVKSYERYIQPDGTHPNAEGSRILAKTVYDSLKPLLRK